MASTGLEIIQVARRAGSGGVGGVVASLDLAFRQLGVRSRLVTADDLGAVARRPSRLGQALEVIGFTFLGTLAAVRARHGGAIVLVHGDALGGDIYVDHGLHKALLARKPWLLLRNPLHAFILAREELRHGWPGHRRVACLSPGAEVELRRQFPGTSRMPVAQVRNGVDAVRFHPDPVRMAHAPSLGDCRLVFVGHEFERKGLHHLLDALARLPDGVRLTVVGGRAGEVQRAQRRVEKRGLARRVDLLGVRSDVEQWLRRSDILVLPSAWEASPLVALEAMASGVPVLLAGAPSGAALLGEGLGGRTIAADGAAIAQTVGELVGDPAAFLAMRRSARAYAEGFAWPAVAAGYVALAEEVRRERAAACAS